jgi:hypothetical protein
MFVQTFRESFLNRPLSPTPTKQALIDFTYNGNNGVALYTNAMTTPDLTTYLDSLFGDTIISPNEVVGTGYSSGGYFLNNQTWGATTTGGNLAWLNTVNPNWTGSTLSNVQGCIYWATAWRPSGADSLGVLAYNFGTAVSTVSGTLTISLAASTIFAFDLIP